jgi:hypothetical protein
MRTTFPCCDELDRLIEEGERMLPRLQAVLDHDPDSDLVFALHNTTDDLVDLRKWREEHRAFHLEERRRIELEVELIIKQALVDELVTAEAKRTIARGEHGDHGPQHRWLDWKTKPNWPVKLTQYAIFDWFMRHDEWPTPQEAWQSCMKWYPIDQPSAQALVAQALDDGLLLGMHTAVAVRLGEAKDHGADDTPFRIYVPEDRWDALRKNLDYDHLVEDRIAELLNEQS